MSYKRSSGKSFKQWLHDKKSGATDLKEPEIKEPKKGPKAKKAQRKPKAKK